jgi:hypothetical protein
MFDPTEWVCGGRWGYIMRHCRTDYMQGSPLIERMNPLRYQIGIGRKRPCRFIWNKGGWMVRAWSDLNWRLWKRRYRAWRNGR